MDSLTFLLLEPLVGEVLSPGEGVEHIGFKEPFPGVQTIGVFVFYSIRGCIFEVGHVPYL